MTGEIRRSLGNLHPLLTNRPEPDIRSYWEELPHGKKTSTTAVLFAFYPVVFYGGFFGTIAVLCFGTFWQYIGVAVGVQLLGGIFYANYRKRVSRESTRFKREFPELFEEYDVTTRVGNLDESNAMLTRCGREQYLLLDSDAFQYKPPAEVKATIAHELGHLSNHDLWKRVIVSWLLWIPQMVVLWVAVQQPSIASVEAVIGVFIVRKLFLWWLCRRQEFRADRFALRHVGEKTPVERWLFRLQYSDFRSEGIQGWVRTIFSTHPRTSERLQRIRGREVAERDS